MYMPTVPVRYQTRTISAAAVASASAKVEDALAAFVAGRVPVLSIGRYARRRR